MAANGQPATPQPQITAAPTPTPVPLPVAQLGIGSKQVSDKDGMTLLYVPAGEFTIGGGSCSGAAVPAAGATEKPAGRIVYLDAFWIDQTEVTNAQFKKFVDATGYQTGAEKQGASFIFDSNIGLRQAEGVDWQHPQGPSTNVNGLDNHPVVQVSWNDAQAYCQWAGGNLPTDEQWEKAARSNDKRTYPWGNDAVAGNLLNFADRNLDTSMSDKNVDDGYQFTSPVGHYPAGASPYGALDMAGNVWEWAKDLYHEKYDDNAPASSSDRIIRGGSWSSNATQAVASCSYWNNPDKAAGLIGFRCAR